MDPSNILTRRELANIFKISTRTLDRYVQKYKYPFFYVGTNIRFDLDEVLKHIKDHQPNIGVEGDPKSGSRKRPAYRADLDNSDGLPDPHAALLPGDRVKVRVDSIVMQEEGPPVFTFGEHKHRLDRQDYDLAEVGQASGPLLMRAHLWVSKEIYRDLQLQAFLVEEEDE
jgi:hypothetical protein